VIVGSLLLILVAVGLLVAGVLGGSNALIVCSIAVVVLAAIVLVIGVRQSAAVGGSLDDVDDDADADELTNEYAMSDSGFRVRQAERRSRSERSDARMDVGEEPAGVVSRRGSRTMVDDEPAAMGETTADHGPLAVDAPIRGIPSQGYPDETEQHAPVYETPAYETSAYQSTAYETQLIEAVTDDVDVDDDEDPPDEPSAQLVSPASAARVAMLSTEVLVVDGRPRYHVPGCVHLLSRETEPIPVGEAVELGFTPCGLCEPDSALLADARRV
jgi:hypothetical protein